MTEAAAMAKDLAAAGVHGVVIAWADNNGIPRARIVPVAALPEAADRGVGITTLFAVFDTHDAITFAHPGLGHRPATCGSCRSWTGSHRWPGNPHWPGRPGGRLPLTAHRGPTTSAVCWRHRSSGPLR